MKEAPPRRKPDPVHYEVARATYELENPGLKFEDLPTRRRNDLAKEQMYHADFHGLCKAIMGERK